MGEISEALFCLEEVNLAVDQAGKQHLLVTARRINEDLPGQLHPQPVQLLFPTVKPEHIKEIFIDLQSLCEESFEIRCIGHFEGLNNLNNIYNYPYDIFKVDEFAVAHDYGDTEPSVPDQIDIPPEEPVTLITLEA